MDFNNSFDEQVSDLESSIFWMYWGQLVVDLMERARKILPTPDAKDSVICQLAVGVFARDLESSADLTVPWRRYNEVYLRLRQLQRQNESDRRSKKAKDERKELTCGDATLEQMEKIALKIEGSGIDFKYIRRDGKANKTLVVLCALLWVTGEGK